MDAIAEDGTPETDDHDPLDPQLSIEDPDQSACDQDESRSEEEVSGAVHARNVGQAAVPLAAARW